MYIYCFYCQDFIVNIAVFNLVDSYLVQAKDFPNFLQNFYKSFCNCKTEGSSLTVSPFFSASFGFAL